MAKFCAKCGNEMGDNDVFCLACGNMIQEQPQPQEQPVAQPPMPEQVAPQAYTQVYQQPLPPQQPVYQSPVQPQIIYVQQQPKPSVPGRGFAIASLVLSLINIIPTIFLTLVFVFAGLLVVSADTIADDRYYYDGYYYNDYQYNNDYYDNYYNNYYNDYYNDYYGAYNSGSDVHLSDVAFCGTDTGVFAEPSRASLSVADEIGIGTLILWFMQSVTMSVMAVLFASAAKRRGYNTGVRKTGLVFGWIEFFLCVLSVLILFYMLATVGM